MCEFNDSGRSSRYNVFFIVKHDIDNIQPSDNPERQDKYSTSCCSIQVSKDGQRITQITSRYNHNVNGCDNTFNSNLDNICPDLCQGFNNEFGYSIDSKGLSVEFNGFVRIDNTYIHYNKEVNGVKFGDNVVITHKPIFYDPNKYYIYDYFIINLSTAKIEWNSDDMGYKDGFVKYFNDTVKKIVFVKDLDLVEDDTTDEVCYLQKG